MRVSAIQRFFRTFLFCSLVGVGLLVVGCDSSGSNGDNYSWTGQWEVIEASNVDLSAVNIYYDITSEKVKIIFESDQIGCQTETEEITNIDGNEITTEDSDGGKNTATVKVKDNGNLFVEGIGENDGTATAKPVDSVPNCN